MNERATKEEMIEKHLKKRGIKSKAVLKAMEDVNRESFIPPELRDYAYEDGPLPIGKNQTISQPYIVAFMAQALELPLDAKILEVGSGCGYNSAVLSKLAAQVYSLEIIEELAQTAQRNLSKEKIDNVYIKFGDGYKGWPEKAPFDAVILTAAASEIPAPLKKQLKVGGKLLAPVGSVRQELILLEKIGEAKYRQKTLLPVRFVPMTGIAQKKETEIPEDRHGFWRDI